MRLFSLVALVTSLNMLALVAPASAADTPATPATASLQPMYDQLLQNPLDRHLNLNYAAQAMQMQDYEAAIPPLERISMNEPQNAKIRLQIGILYHMLKSDAIAKQYFLEARAITGAPAEVTKEAEQYLHDM